MRELAVDPGRQPFAQRVQARRPVEVGRDAHELERGGRAVGQPGVDHRRLARQLLLLVDAGPALRDAVVVAREPAHLDAAGTGERERLGGRLARERRLRERVDRAVARAGT